ncbi:MAG TPA: hypothetical protein VIF14_02500 [Alphaproteobacteria bacterium]
MLILVEDPGAAAYASGVPEALQRSGHSACVLAAGHAAVALKKSGQACEYVGDLSEALALLRAVKPRAIAVGTAEHSNAIGLALIGEARRRGIPSIGLVDGPANAAFRFRGVSNDPLRHAPDCIAVPDDWTREEFIALGAAAGRVRVCGHPGRDALYANRDSASAMRRGTELRRRWLARRRRPVVVFATELSTGPNGQVYCRTPDYTLAGTSGADGRTEIVLEEFLRAVRNLNPRPCLVLRLHPKTPLKLYAAYRAAFDGVSRKESRVDAVLAADVVVGLTSVILDEAVLLGRAALSIGPRIREKEWLDGARHGLVPVVAERAAIRPALRRAIAGHGMPSRARVEKLLPRGAADNVARLILEAGRVRSAA